MQNVVAASWRVFQKAVDLPTGVQKEANALQEKGPDEVTYNSVSRNALPSPRCSLGDVSLANRQAPPSQQGVSVCDTLSLSILGS